MPGEKRYYYSRRVDPELTDDVFTSILTYGISSAAHFEAHFPDDDSCLAEGKEEFRQLPQVSVGPWSGMEGAITVSGEMTPEARELFMKSVEEKEPWLWDYNLFRDGKELLSIADHSDLVVTESFIKEYMEKLIESWFRPIVEPETVQSERAKEVLEVIKEMTARELSDLLRKF